jgi:soluble lytic murein transglycosylase
MASLSSSKSWVLAVVLALGTGFSACGTHPILQRSSDYGEEIRARKPDPKKVTEGEGVRLSVALQKSLSTDPLSAERIGLLKFIQNSKAKGPKFASSQSSVCEKRFHAAPECAFLRSDWLESFLEEEEGLDQSDQEVALKTSQRASSQKLTRAMKRKHSKVIEAVRRSLLKGVSERVDGQIEGDIYRALKKVDGWSSGLEEFAKRLGTQEKCENSELYVYLGLKGEEYFPDEVKMNQVLSLYRKADQCNLQNTSDKYVQLARFRLGLLSIVKNDCKESQAVFTRLSKMGANDYSTRALYWNAYCARAESNKEEFLASFDELFKTNPLGYHTLTINHGDSILVENITKPMDPIVKTRTSLEGPFNLWIKLLEDFDRIGAASSVYSLLAPVRKNPETMLRLEPGVRLYLSTFSFRAKDMIALFRMLDSVFRTQSEYVVDSTLRLFYPLRFSETIVQEAKKVNPLLVAALIRQESAFQETVKSRVGAVGLMQLMPATARLMDRKVKRASLLRPEVNIRIGVRYFQALIDRFGGDVELALASYNAGAEVVDRWQKRYPTKNRLLFLDLMPYAETRNYVTLIGRNYYWYTKIYGDQLKDPKGIADTTPSEFRGMKSD